MSTPKKAAKKAAKKTPAKANTATPKIAKKTDKKTAKKATRKVSRKTVAKKTGKATARQTKGAAKSSAKRASSRTTKERTLVDAPYGETFWAHSGDVIANLRELEGALQRMHDEAFLYHVSKNKNDFADWVELVLKDKDCASALRRSRKRNTAHAIVVKHLKRYTH